jgi:hypothetical protein
MTTTTMPERRRRESNKQNTRIVSRCPAWISGYITFPQESWTRIVPRPACVLACYMQPTWFSFRWSFTQIKLEPMAQRCFCAGEMKTSRLSSVQSITTNVNSILSMEPRCLGMRLLPTMVALLVILIMIADTIRSIHWRRGCSVNGNQRNKFYCSKEYWILTY